MSRNHGNSVHGELEQLLINEKAPKGAFFIVDGFHTATGIVDNLDSFPVILIIIFGIEVAT